MASRTGRMVSTKVTAPRVSSSGFPRGRDGAEPPWSFTGGHLKAAAGYKKEALGIANPKTSVFAKMFNGMFGAAPPKMSGKK